MPYSRSGGIRTHTSILLLTDSKSVPSQPKIAALIEQQAKHGLNVRDLTHSYRQKSFKYFPSVFCPFILTVILISNAAISESNHTIGKPIEPLLGFYGVILNV